MRTITFAAFMVMTACYPCFASGSTQNLVIPANAPSLNEIEVAMGALEPSLASPGAGLIPLTDNDGNVVDLESDDGAYGSAFYDSAGNTIISYEFAMRPTQSDISIETLTGIVPASIPAYNDALTFAGRVVAITSLQGRSSNQVYLTGFSEGADLASFVGWQTGLPGLVFAASGMPGYAAHGALANNFISLLEANDPIAQYGTDTFEQASAIVASRQMDHYGTVIQLESTSSDMLTFTDEIAGSSLQEFNSGVLNFSQTQINAAFALEGRLQTSAHSLPLYSADTNAFAASYGY